MRFDNIRDAVHKMQGTMVLHAGRAFLVEDIGARQSLIGRYILDDEHGVVEQDDPALVFSGGELGYVNTPREALYCMRVPRRRWKQGIDLQGVAFPGKPLRHRAGVDYVHLAKCVEGKYPTLTDALGMFEGRNPFRPTKRKSVAFSRHFSVAQSGEGTMLQYKGSTVGVVEEGRAILEPKHMWLNELLEAEL